MWDHSAGVSNRFRPRASWSRRCLSILVASALLSWFWAGRTLAYHPPEPGDKVYANRINLQDPELGRKRHNIGLLDIMITNMGCIGNNQMWVPSEFGATWRGDTYLYLAGLWIGAVAGDDLAYVSTGAYETELLPSPAPVDHIYSAQEGVEHGSRPGFSAQPDDDSDGRVDEDPLNGKDDDGDGAIDEDYAAISQQMYSCEYWDYTPEAQRFYPRHRPLGIRVQQQSYAWSTTGANEFVGFDFKVVNDGFEMLRQVYLGFFGDSDVGPTNTNLRSTDDGGGYYATDTTFVDQTVTYSCRQAGSGATKNCADRKVPLSICYMYDIPDNGSTARGGDAPGYFGLMLLDHTTDPLGARAPSTARVHTAQFFDGSARYPDGDPVIDSQRYEVLQAGSAPVGSIDDPDDYRYCLSVGPFPEMAPGDELRLQVAFVIGMGKTGMITNALTARRVYDGQWRDVDNDLGGQGDRRTGINGRETCLRALQVGEPLTWQDPCDSLNPATRTITDTTCLPDNYVDNDCDCCTPLFPSQSEADSGPGLEALIHWVGPTVPTPPGPFSLLAPADGESLATTEPLLRWGIARELDPGGPVRYTVYWSADSLFGSSDSMEAGTRTNYLIGPFTLLSGTTYHWKVRAHDTFGLGRWSDPAEGFVFHTPPSTPVGLELQAQASDSGLRLTWSVPADLYALGFAVYRRIAGAEEWVCLAPLLSGDGTTVEFVDGTAEPGVVYEYEVEVLGPSGPAGRWGPVSAALPPVSLWLGLSPNPGRQTLTVSFGLPQPGPATFRLFNSAGREVARKVTPGLRAGNQSVIWTPGDGLFRRLPSGAYWIRLDTSAGFRTAPWMVIK